MMLDTSAHYGQSFGQQAFGPPYGQSFGQQAFGPPYGQSFGQQPFGPPYGQSFGQQAFGPPYGQSFVQQPFSSPYGQSFGQQAFGPLYGQSLGQQPYSPPYGQSFGQPFGVPAQVMSQPPQGNFAPGGGWPGSVAASAIPVPLALQSLCAQLGPLAALQLGIPQLGLPPFGVAQPGGFGGLGIGGWPVPFGGLLATPLTQQHSYPIGQAMWGWSGHPAFTGLGGIPSALATQGFLGHMALGNPGIAFGPRTIGGGVGAPSGGFAPFLATPQPLAYVS